MECTGDVEMSPSHTRLLTVLALDPVNELLIENFAFRAGSAAKN